MHRVIFLFLLFFLPSSNLLFAQPAFSRELLIFRSKDYVSTSYKVQNFQDRLAMPEGEQTLPMTMALYNGLEAPSFKWFRIMINGILIASEKDMQGKDRAAKDVSGLIRGSDLQVIVEAGGVPGSHLFWTLSVPQLELNYSQPHDVRRGESLKLIGKNFPSDPNLLRVYLNNKECRVNSVENNSTLTVTVPQDADVGANRLQISTGSYSSNPISTNILSRPIPEIMGIDCWMAPPGGTINISGRNFSPNQVDNQVYFGDVQGEVTFASPTRLSVTVPNWSYGPSQLNIPVSVEVSGVRSANTYPFDIGPSYHGAIPQFGHD